MSGDELYGVDAWIKSVLAGDATITGLVSTRIYSELADQNTLRPYVVFSELSSIDSKAVGGIRILVNSLYIIKFVTDLAMSSVKTGVDQLDVLFDRRQVTTASTYIFSSSRERPYRKINVTDGRRVNERGAIFRIQSQKI